MPTITRPVLIVAGALLLVAAIYANWTSILFWVQGAQRAMQSQLAIALQAVRAGDMTAIATLIMACFSYGVLHAIGPGHGKVLVTGAAVASRRTAIRMALIGFSASLVQAVSAVLLAYGSLGLLKASGSAVIGNANAWLVPISFVLMALVGVWIVVRGARLVYGPAAAGMRDILSRQSVSARAIAADGPVAVLNRSDHAVARSSHKHEHHHAHDHPHDHAHAHDHRHGHTCGAGCKHMPTAHETEALESWRDVGALILSIGMRPCSGALIVLIISWQLNLYVVGALGAFAMAVGTGLIVGLVALFAAAVRDGGLFRLGAQGEAISMSTYGWIQIAAGVLVIAFCLAFLTAIPSGPAPTGLVR